MEFDITGYNFGHPIRYDHTKKEWLYFDGKANTNEVYQDLVCPKCNMKPTEKGHDPCIANLEDVKYACCGHGINEGEQAYIMYENGETVRFKSTEKLHEYLKNKKDA